MQSRTLFLHSRLLLSVAFPLLAAAAQNQLGDQSNPAFFLRLQHQRQDSDVCALLRTNGQYHLERRRGEKTVVFEGAATPARVAELQALVNSHPFRQISPKQFPLSVINSARNKLLIHFWQNGESANLAFSSQQSQEPYLALLHPLLQWLDEVQKNAHDDLGEDQARTNCLPPRDLTLKTR